MEKIIGIDAETTGLDPMTDELLQVSIVDSDGNVLFDEYICPKTRSGEVAESINHITYIAEAENEVCDVVNVDITRGF